MCMYVYMCVHVRACACMCVHVCVCHDFVTSILAGPGRKGFEMH